MQVRALVALLALTMAITLGFSLRDDSDPPRVTAAGAASTALALRADTTAPSTRVVTDAGTSKPAKKKRKKRRGIDCRKVKCVALTFDDGPGLDTGRLLKILAQKKAKATFFLVGSMVQARPDVARRIARRGHEVGVHTMGHPDLTRLSDKWARWQLRRGKAVIKQATGATPTVSRPPYGATNRRILRFQGELGLSEILWDVDTSDWKIRNARHVSDTAVRQARRNSVILTHDIRPTTVNAVPSMVRGLRKRGFTLVTVSELIGNPKPGRTYFDWRNTTPKKTKPKKAKKAASKPAVKKQQQSQKAGGKKNPTSPRKARKRKGKASAH